MKQRIIVFAIIAAIALLSSPFINIANAPTDPYWFDTAWHFRTALTINNTDYSRDYWPIEQNMNFTSLISQTGKNGTFDYASIRIYEHNSTGGVMHSMKYQFDNASGANASSNAAGMLVFLMNGTTAANATRYFYIYFDIIENGAKTPPSFTTNLNYSWNGKEAHVNNTELKWKIDTLRNENTSGIYDVRGASGTIIFTQASSNRTIEYMQYSNGTNNLSFDFRNNATFISGPVRLTIEQVGNETLWNDPDTITGAGRMKKTYIFYESTKWLKITQNFTNIGGASITRNSTNGGALSINEITYNGLIPPFGNESNPMSRYGASDGSRGVGIISVNSSSNANYSAIYDSGIDRIGINLNSTTLTPQESITQTTAMQFDDVQYNDDQNLLPLRNQLLYPPVITQYNPQYISYKLASKTNYTIHNRNESVLITGNTTSDPYNVISSMNATLDRGTADTGDDIIMVLYDDGSASHGDETASDSIFSNFFNLSEDSAIGTWNITINAYDSLNILLNRSSTTFNVTNEYNTSINISNPDGFVERIINATITVKNKRHDTYIPGATLNCSYNSSGELTNITDYNNGTYLLNFTAPSVTGSYLLNCSAKKFNNTGWESQWFYTETSQTTLLLNITPENYTAENITRETGESFIIALNATDIGGANAKYTNMTISLPQNITANATNANCGTVYMQSSCLRDFNITIANGTSPGNYTLNASVAWGNPDDSTNTTNTTFTVYVLSNPQINVTPANISGNVPDGRTVNIGNFTVWSVGNDNIINTTFNVTGLPGFSVSFSPQNISTLAAGSSQEISVNVSIPLDYAPGNYTGTINASSINDEWKTIEINITVPSISSISINKMPQNYTARNISYSDSESFNITVNTSNNGITGAKDVNITLSLPQNLSANSTIEACGNISANSFCARQFNITISNQTAPGNYTFNITSTWKNPDSSINSTTTNVTVTVLSNPVLNISEGGLSATLFDNATIFAGNFTVYSIGNDNLTNIIFNVTGLPNFTFAFEPANISTLGMNDSQNVSVNVSVPFAHSPGNYTGTMNVSSINGGWKAIEINVSVLIRRNWSISPTYCTRAENPDTGTVCSVAVSNTGNVPMNFTVNPSGVNYTSANETNFTVAKNSTHSLAFLYNVSNITKDFFYSFYTINATDADAYPQYMNFNITLIPYVVPLFSVNVLPNETEQGNIVEIFVNVTDRSTTGINWTQMNVTLPNGTIEMYNMTLIGNNDTVSIWYFNYSGNMTTNTTINITDENGTVINTTNITVSLLNYTGNTMSRGIYNISIVSQDNTGVAGEANESFKIYAKKMISFMPGSIKYYQGQKGSIYYTAKELNGTGFSWANVSITIIDPAGNTTYYQNFTTNENGQISPIPSFELNNDYLTGTYNLTANMAYYDNLADKQITSSDNTSFSLLSGSSGGGGGLKADLRTTVVWYPDNIMRFQMFFSYAGNVTAPDNMTLQVFDPANNDYFSITLADLNETTPGRYQYSYAMPINTASGDYYAVLTAYKDGFMSYDINSFRVAKGGPYDVKLTVLPPLEVPRQDYLSFEVLVENMGEVTQDVYIDYWTSYENNTYYYSGEAILTPVGVNKTVVRTAYIFSDQPLGMNLLNVKVIYDNVQAPIILNASFEVIDESIDIPPPPPTSEPPPGGGGGGGSGGGGVIERIIYLPAEETPETGETGIGKRSSIDIESYNKDINIVRGWTALESVKVKNTGNTTLTNVSLSISGIPSSWFKITPENYETMAPGNSTIFLIEFKIPTNAESGTYHLVFTASSSKRTSEKVGRLIIFTSIEELVNQEILNLKIEVEKLADDTRYSERLGRNISQMREIIDSARAQIKLAEDNADKKAFDDALLNTQTASGLIKRGKRLLESIVTEEPPASQKPALNAWLMGLLALLIIVIIAAIALWTIRSKGKLKWENIKAYLKKITERKEKSAANEELKKSLVAEKEKIMRMTKLLENELKEGIITQNAYNELKKRNDEKQARIDQQIKKL